jgi:hypothetical protein
MMCEVFSVKVLREMHLSSGGSIVIISCEFNDNFNNGRLLRINFIFSTWQKTYKFMSLGYRMKTIIALLVLALLVLGCSAQPPVAPNVPAPVENVEPAEEKIEEVVPATEQVYGVVNKTSALDVDSVRCDSETRTITFRFSNNDTRRWQMNQKVGWDSPRDLAAVRVFVNSYEVNGRNQYIVNGEKYFGPNWPFSENCGGVEELAPGEDVTCTLSPVSLKAANAVSAGKNEIFIDSPTSHHIIQFLCE